MVLFLQLLDRVLKGRTYRCAGRTSSGNILTKTYRNSAEMSHCNGVFPLAGFFWTAHLTWV